MLDAVGLCRYRGPASQDPSEGSALAHFLHEVDGSLGIAELGKARLHGNADGRSHLDGVDAEVVVHEIDHGDGVQVVDAAVAAVGPDRLILGLLGKVVAVLVMVYAGALDHAAPVAGMGGHAAALGLERSHGLAADLGCAVKASLLEIVGRIAAHFVQDIGQDVRAEGRKALAGHRMLAEPFHELLVRLAELLGVLRRPRRLARVIEDDDLDVLGTHHRTHAAPACVARWPELHVRARHGRGGSSSSRRQARWRYRRSCRRTPSSSFR